MKLKVSILNAISFILLALFVQVSGFDPELSIINRCNETVWIGAVGESKVEPNWKWLV